jgi:AcrR family transcriptional regulator
MASRSTKSSLRRQPQQRRAHQTVEAILDAVVRILKREGFQAITTNRVAEVAGVSIGSLYQYFPDRPAIFEALHRRHIEEVDRLFARKFMEHAGSPLDQLIRALVDAMVEAHTTDSQLYELLSTEVPHRKGGSNDFSVRLQGAFLLAISSAAPELRKRGNLDKVVFVVTHMIEALCHGAVLRRPPGLSLADAKAEITRAVLAYLSA